jgi:8-oxo-dGTP pyrophosphatase MutT (NUDIX family)
MLANPNSVYGSILITSDRKVLVIRGRKSGKWSFPKGHSEENESELDAAIRETKEETGLVLNTWYQQCVQLATGIYFLYNVNEQICKPLDIKEVIETRWVSLYALKKMNVNIDVNTFLRKYSCLLKKKEWNGFSSYTNQTIQSGS